MKCSRETVILRGIFHVVSRFPLHFMLNHENLDYFSNSVDGLCVASLCSLASLSRLILRRIGPEISNDIFFSLHCLPRVAIKHFSISLMGPFSPSSTAPFSGFQGPGLNHAVLFSYYHLSSYIPRCYDSSSVAEPEPVEPKLFGTWSRSRN